MSDYQPKQDENPRRIWQRGNTSGYSPFSGASSKGFSKQPNQRINGQRRLKEYDRRVNQLDVGVCRRQHSIDRRSNPTDRRKLLNIGISQANLKFVQRAHQNYDDEKLPLGKFVDVAV